VGPSAKEALKRLGINTVFDLLLHLPVGIFDWCVCMRMCVWDEGERRGEMLDHA
jgi:RecG-like helicase